MNSPLTLLVVDDLNLAKAFYLNVLGFTLIEAHDDCLKMAIANHQVIIFEGNLPSNEYQHGEHANSTLVLTVTNLDEKISQLKDKGVSFIHQQPNQNIWGRYAAFKDPAGIVHELMELS